jgi:hypothetical protein
MPLGRFLPEVCAAALATVLIGPPAIVENLLRAAVTSRRRLAAFLLVLVASAFLVALPFGSRLASEREPVEFVLLLAAVVLIFLFAALSAGKPPTVIVQLQAMVTACVALALLFTSPWVSPQHGAKYAASMSYFRSWREVQEWARLHTARDAVFMVPPASLGFRIFSQRSSWVDWKDFDGVYTWPPYLVEWEHRVEDLGISFPPGRPVALASMSASYREKALESLRAVARRHRISFIIRTRDAHDRETPVFVNETFAVYTVTP